MNMRNGRVAVFDLNSSEMTEEDIVEGATVEEMSSIRMAEALSRKHGDDSLVLGTGFLTGCFAPAACAGIVRAKGERGQDSKIMPLLGNIGFELKMSGFDFVVLKGVAGKPGYIWIRDGHIDLIEAEGLRAIDSWARTDKIRAEQGDAKIQVLSTGPWCDAGSDSSQIVTDYWGGEDKMGMGAELGRRNLLAIAVRGMGELECGECESQFDAAERLIHRQLEKLGPNQGLGSYCAEAANEEFRSLTHRVVSCFGCPYPCRSFVFDRTGALGYLHYDIPAIRELLSLGIAAKDWTSILANCAKAGAEPVSVLTAARESGGVSLEGVVSILKRPGSSPPQNVKNFEFPTDDGYRAMLGLGVCPRYWSKTGSGLSDLAPFLP